MGAPAGAAIANIARESLGSAIKEGGLPWLESFGAFLRRSNIGVVAEKVFKTDFEPMLKQVQVRYRQGIEQVFAAVPPTLHSQVTDGVISGRPNTNPVVQQAVQQLTRHYQNKAHLNIDFQGYGSSEVEKWLNWNRRVATKETRMVVFGEKDELLTSLLLTAERERGSHYANSVADGLSVYFHENQAHVGYREKAAKLGQGITAKNRFSGTTYWERWLRDKMSYTFTSRIAIPHLTQALNSILVNGTKATAKAASFIFDNGIENAKQHVINSGAFEDEIFYQLEREAKQQGGIVSKLFGKLKQPFFHDIRNFQILLHAVGGEFSAREAAESLIRGKPEAEIQLKLLGLDPVKIRRMNGVLDPTDIMTAQYRAAQEGMFIRSGIDTPYAWDLSWGRRAVAMYKHYMFNEGRLLADSFKRAYAVDKKAGRRVPTELLKTIGFVATAFPIAGEAVKILENVVTGHDPGATPKATDILGVKKEEERTIADEYIDALGYSAGLGVAASMFHSVKRRGLANYLLGPVIGTPADLLQDLAVGNMTEVYRDFASKVPLVGPALSNITAPRGKEKKTY